MPSLRKPETVSLHTVDAAAGVWEEPPASPALGRVEDGRVSNSTFQMRQLPLTIPQLLSTASIF